MIYFSELKGKKVTTEDHVDVGVLEDIVFISSENALITKIVVRNKLKQILIIPSEFLIKINKQLFVKKEFIISSIVENELFVLRNLLDKQIIDLKGNKIVRVNDVAIQDKGSLYIAGVDIGILGILRWLKIEALINLVVGKIGVNVTSSFLSWADIQPLELTRGKVILKKIEEKLTKIRPEDLADYLEKTNIHNARKFLNLLDDKKATEVISNLNLNYQTDFFRHFDPVKSVRIISNIDPDEAVDILLSLNSKRREAITNLLPEKKKNELLRLISLSKTHIGELISTEFLTLNSNILVKDAIQKIKQETSDFFYFNVIYVTNKENQLVGVFSLHDMLLQQLDAPLYKFMIQNVIVIHIHSPLEIAVRKMFKYRLHSLPVVDDDKHILGILTIDDAGKTLFKDKL